MITNFVRNFTKWNHALFIYNAFMPIIVLLNYRYVWVSILLQLFSYQFHLKRHYKILLHWQPCYSDIFWLQILIVRLLIVFWVPKAQWNLQVWNTGLFLISYHQYLSLTWVYKPFKKSIRFSLTLTVCLSELCI